MNERESQIAQYIEELRHRKSEDSYHRLLEFGAAALPELIRAYGAESDPEIRAKVVAIVGQARSPESVGFLSRVLTESAPVAWKAALEGLVTLAGPAVMEALEAARERLEGEYNPEKLAWVIEAMDQIRNRIGS